MRSLMIKVQDRAREIKHLQDKVLPDLKQQLAELERKVKESRRPAEKERYAPPERESVRDQLRRLQAEGSILALRNYIYPNIRKSPARRKIL